MGISEDARAMKAYIEENGWIQGRGLDPISKSVCLVGAIWCTSADEVAIRNAITQSIFGCNEYVRKGASIPKWNDANGRTKEEVLEMLENVAIKHEGDEYRSGGNA